MRKTWVVIVLSVVMFISYGIYSFIHRWVPGDAIDHNLSLDLKNIDDLIIKFADYEDYIKEKGALSVNHTTACKVLAGSVDFYNNLEKYSNNLITLDQMKEEVYRSIISDSSIKTSITIQVLEPWLDWSEISNFKQYGIVASNLDPEIINIAITESSALICQWVNEGVVKKELTKSFIDFNNSLLGESRIALSWLNVDVDEIKEIHDEYTRLKKESKDNLVKYAGKEIVSLQTEPEKHKKQAADQINALITISNNVSQITLNAARKLRDLYEEQDLNNKLILAQYGHNNDFKRTENQLRDWIGHLSTLSSLGSHVYDFLKLTNRSGVFCDYNFVNGCQLDLTNESNNVRLWGKLNGNYDNTTHTGYRGAGVPSIKWLDSEKKWDITNTVSLLLGIEQDVLLPVPDMQDRLNPLVITDENDPLAVEQPSPFYTNDFKLGIEAPSLTVKYVIPNNHSSSCDKLNCNPSITITRNELTGLNWNFVYEKNMKTSENDLTIQNFLYEIGLSELFTFSSADIDFSQSAVLDLKLKIPTLASADKVVNLRLDLLDPNTFSGNHIRSINESLIRQAVDLFNNDISLQKTDEWNLPNNIKNRSITNLSLMSMNPLLFNADVVDEKALMNFDVVLMLDESLFLKSQIVQIDDDVKHASLVGKMTKTPNVLQSLRNIDAVKRKVNKQVIEHFEASLSIVREDNSLSSDQLKTYEDARSYFINRAVDSFLAQENLDNLENTWGIKEAQKLTFDVGLAYEVMIDMMRESPEISYSQAAEMTMTLIGNPKELKRNHYDVLKKQITSYMRPSDSLELLIKSVDEIKNIKSSLSELAKKIPKGIELKEVRNEGFELSFKVGPSTSVSSVPIILPESWDHVIQIKVGEISDGAKQHWNEISALGSVVEEVTKDQLDSMKKASEAILNSKAVQICKETIGYEHIVCTNPNVILKIDKYANGIINSYLDEIEKLILKEVDEWTNDAYQNFDSTIKIVLSRQIKTEDNCQFEFDGKFKIPENDIPFDEYFEALILEGKPQSCLLANIHSQSISLISDITSETLEKNKIIKSIPSECDDDMCKSLFKAKLTALRSEISTRLDEQSDLIIRKSILMLSSSIQKQLPLVLDWVNAFESMVLEYASKTGIPAFIGGVCLNENNLDTNSIKPPPCPEGYTFYKDVSDINFEALAENFSEQKLDEIKTKIEETAKQVCLDNFNYSTEVLPDQSLCTALENPEAFKTAMKQKAEGYLNDIEKAAEERLKDVIEGAVGTSYADVEKDIKNKIKGICDDIKKNSNFKIFGAQVVVDHNCPNPPSSANVKAGFVLFDRYFEITSGLDFNAQGSGQLIDMKKLVITPRIESVIAEEITNKVDGITVTNASFTDNVFRADVLFQPGNLPWPVTSRIEITDFSNFGIDINVDDFINNALVSVGKEVCSQLKPLAELVAESIPFTKVVEVNEPTCIRSEGEGESKKEFLDLSKLKLTFSLEADFFDGLKPIIPIEITVAKGLQFGDINLEGPISKYLEKNSGFTNLQYDDPLFETEGGFKLNLIAAIDFPLGDGELGITLPFTISRDGIEPRGALELNLPGWYPIGIFSFGNLGAKYDIKEKIFGIQAAFSFVEGNVMNKVIRIDGSGEIKIEQKELTIHGDLIFSDLLTLASSESKLNFDERLISTSVNSGPMLKDLFELNGTIRIQDKEPAPFFLATGRGELFGAELAQGKFDMKLTKDFAADFAVDVNMPIGTHEIVLKSDRGLKNLSFGSNITFGGDGLEVGINLIGNNKFVQVTGTAKVADVPFSVNFTTESLKGVSLDNLLDDLFDLNLDLPYLTTNIDLFAQGREDDVDESGFVGVEENIPPGAVKSNVVIDIPDMGDIDSSWSDSWIEELRYVRVCKRIVKQVGAFRKCDWEQHKFDEYRSGNSSMAKKVFSKITNSPSETRHAGGMIKIDNNAVYALLFKRGEVYVFDHNGEQIIWQGRFKTNDFSRLNANFNGASIAQRQNVANGNNNLKFRLISSQKLSSNKSLALVYVENKYVAIESGTLIDTEFSNDDNYVSDGQNNARIILNSINDQISVSETNQSSIPFADMVASAVKMRIHPNFYRGTDSNYCMTYQKLVPGNGSYKMTFISDFKTSENKLIGLITNKVIDTNSCANFTSVQVIKDLMDSNNNAHCVSSNSLDDICGVAFIYINDSAVLFEEDNQLFLRAKGFDKAPVNHVAHLINLEGVMIYAENIEDTNTFPHTNKNELIKVFTGLYKNFDLPNNDQAYVSSIDFIEANLHSYPSTAMRYESGGENRYRLLDSNVNCYLPPDYIIDPNDLSILDKKGAIIIDLWTGENSAFTSKWPTGPGAIARPGVGSEWPKPFLEVLVNRNFKDKGFAANPIGSMEKDLRCAALY